MTSLAAAAVTGLVETVVAAALGGIVFQRSFQRSARFTLQTTLNCRI
jgi:hypothetical protein